MNGSARGRILRVCVLCLAACVASPSFAQVTFTVLENLNGTDGAEPLARLVQGLDGSLYGTTVAGGAFNGGAVFKFTPGHALTRALHSFCRLVLMGCPDGLEPVGELALGTDGNLYGTAWFGSNQTCFNGCGTVFKIAPDGTFTLLHAFDGTDGSNPQAGLVQGMDGNFYGATVWGGNNNCMTTPAGCGVIFKMTPDGTVTTLYKFCSKANCPDGESPLPTLVQGADGNFYGTTQGGGLNASACVSTGCGTVFKISPAGKFTTIYRFCSLTNCTDGNLPFGPLVQGADRNFYGTTRAGGGSTFTSCPSTGCGTVFKISPEGKFTTIYRFCSLTNCADGAIPSGGLIQATDGNLYGTNQDGGANTLCQSAGGCGTAFKMTTAGVLTTLHAFCSQTNCADGSFPRGAPLQSTDGSFYGTTEAGGTDNDGVIFNLSVGLHPFVRTLPGFGTVGATIDILGTDLTGATSVTFNGTAATFIVVSASEITAAVPSGATTGPVRVKTPAGTLSTPTQFLVKP